MAATIRTILMALPLVATLAAAGPAAADWAPKQPIKVVIPFGAGGSTDVFGRVVFNEMEKMTGWKILVENRPGAGGVIGQVVVRDAKPDGHTLGLSSTTVLALQPFMPDAPKEALPESFDYVGTLSLIPYAIVAGKDAPFDDLASLAAYAKAKGPVKFSSTAPELTLAMEQIAKSAGFPIVAAQTSGSGESLQLVAGRHADITISGGVHVPYVTDGRMKVIAIMGDDRATYAPNAKTVEEQGAELPLRNYFLLNAPKKLDPEAKAAIAKAFDAALNSEAVAKYAEKIHVKVKNLGPDGSTADMTAQAKKWRAHFGQ
jgi:tripartite-type tricarboxylate transporter receptor subunit TctC